MTPSVTSTVTLNVTSTVTLMLTSSVTPSVIPSMTLSMTSSVTPPCRTWVEMPQTNKAPGLQSGSDQDEPPPPLQEVRSQQVGGASSAADQDQGDPDIVKSPSDPKRYRWEGGATRLCCLS